MNEHTDSTGVGQQYYSFELFDTGFEHLSYCSTHVCCLVKIYIMSHDCNVGYEYKSLVDQLIKVAKQQKFGLCCVRRWGFFDTPSLKQITAQMPVAALLYFIYDVLADYRKLSQHNIM